MSGSELTHSVSQRGRENLRLNFVRGLEPRGNPTLPTTVLSSSEPEKKMNPSAAAMHAALPGSHIDSKRREYSNVHISHWSSGSY